MQIEDSYMTLIALLQFIPSLLLSMLFMADIRKTKTGERATAFLGFASFALFATAFLMTALFRYQYVIDFLFLSEIVLLLYFAYTPINGAAIILLAIWTIAITRPTWFCDRKWLLVIIGFLFWIAYVGLGMFAFFSGDFLLSFFLYNIQGLIRFVMFVFAFAWIILKATTERTALILFVGLLLFYLHSGVYGILIFGYLELSNITFLGLWLILIWKIMTDHITSKKTNESLSQ